MKATNLTNTFNTINKPLARSAEFVEHWSVEPRGGWFKLLLLGVALPLVILLHAYGIWDAGHMTWHGKGNASIEIYGAAAKSWATAFAGGALFCHARWFWGLIPVAWMYTLSSLTALAMIGGGIGYACWSVLSF